MNQTESQTIAQFEVDQYGFWKQIDPNPFQYTVEYKSRQSTNIEMSFLRLGWLSSHLPYEKLKQMNVVDIGSGNGTFLQVTKMAFNRIVGYDLVGPSISIEELETTDWDIIILSDVLEHFEDINHLFDMSWAYAFITVPETPLVGSCEDLVGWRHYKPDEHIWCLNESGLYDWFRDNDCEVIASSNFEDIIRRRWDKNKPNIVTMLVKRNAYESNTSL